MSFPYSRAKSTAGGTSQVQPDSHAFIQGHSKGTSLVQPAKSNKSRHFNAGQGNVFRQPTLVVEHSKASRGERVTHLFRSEATTQSHGGKTNIMPSLLTKRNTQGITGEGTLRLHPAKGANSRVPKLDPDLHSHIPVESDQSTELVHIPGKPGYLAMSR